MTQTALTRDQILSMQPGEELNDLVAEKVMGWHAKSKKWGGEFDEYDEFWHNEQGIVGECEFFRPSGDVADAWQVVRKLQEDAPPVRHVFKELMGGIVIFDMTPELISKAALLAVLDL